MAKDKLKGSLSPIQSLRGNLSKQTQSLSGQISNKGGIITEHRLLKGRGEEDQHPISAITGLEDALSSMMEATEFELTVSQSGNVRIPTSINEIKNAIESAPQTTFVQNHEDGVVVYSLVGANWDDGVILLECVDGDGVSVIELQENNGEMVGILNRTEFINNKNIIEIYCGTSTEVI